MNAFLPQALEKQWEWFDLCHPDWRFVAKHELHRKHGDVFAVISPGCLSVEVADAEVAAEIISRSRYDFVKPTWPYSLLNLFGDNVLSSGGATWRRHRKATASQFSNTIHKQAWTKSLVLGQELLSIWTNNHATVSTVANIAPDLEFLVLRVILSVGYGATAHLNYRTDVSGVPDTGRTSRFAAAMDQVLSNLTKLLMLPNRVLKHGPSHWQSVYESATDVRTFLEDLIWTETQKQKRNLTVAGDSQEANNVLSGLVRQGICSPKGENGREEQSHLSDEEVMGNIFILAFAGAVSTADSLKYSLVLMALHPDIQEWLIQDIEEAINSSGEDTTNPLEWKEETVLSRLVAPYCVMLETLRHYPPVTGINKSTGDKEQLVTFNGSLVLLAEDVNVNMSLTALHHNPKYWGKNALVYCPQNWDTRCACDWAESTSNAPEMSDTTAGTPHVRNPVKGSFLAFSDGARGCLGKRFAQVEFVAILTLIFRQYRVELAVRETESLEDVRRRTQMILDNSASTPTLSLQTPVPLQFMRRN
ncbi:hypothetical protein FE257_004440 [Aspergillus nanangensis]|uniref:Cytochrome P450 n=1 Tax=Aspergillus nanangensis TaxID=2582783 RepID=A0AAD4CY38_ASPNN|nr:hypothetical protein FE257_004440 [Aspergillus nanangensis]